MDMDIVYEYAADQHHVVADWELRELGIGLVDEHLAIRSGALLEVHEGVYRNPEHDLTWLGRCKAATLAFPGGVISHMTAAMLHGLVPVDETANIDLSIAEDPREEADMARREMATRADDRRRLRRRYGVTA